MQATFALRFYYESKEFKVKLIPFRDNSINIDSCNTNYATSLIHKSWRALPPVP